MAMAEVEEGAERDDDAEGEKGNDAIQGVETGEIDGEGPSAPSSQAGQDMPGL